MNNMHSIYLYSFWIRWLKPTAIYALHTNITLELSFSHYHLLIFYISHFLTFSPSHSPNYSLFIHHYSLLPYLCPRNYTTLNAARHKRLKKFRFSTGRKKAGSHRTCIRISDGSSDEWWSIFLWTNVVSAFVSIGTDWISRKNI